MEQRIEPEQEQPEQQQQLVSKEALLEPLQSLPPVEFAAAYGSGVFHQQESSPEMVDYIFGVSSPEDWHSENIKMNPKHYTSVLSSFGGKAVANVARTLGVGVHFNPFVKWQNKVGMPAVEAESSSSDFVFQMIKYGVIGIPDLVTDINTWNRFYISGRLQKPVCVLTDASGIAGKNNVNLRAAFSTAVLSLPYQFSEEELYEAICGLSYLGDIRTLFAEDNAKHPQVTKIVQGSFSNFKSMYSATIDEAASKDLIKPQEGGSYKQDLGAKGICGLVSQLPSTLLQRLAAKTGVKYEDPSETVPIAHALVDQGVVLRPMTVKASVASIVRRSSVRQAVSGFLAAGAINSVKYTSRKMAKALKSIK